ncbi:hypothetical protein ACIBG0_25175 [Nocardia sp. NPDC050630]|uniref:hypothetical protein n=1 Tax=Nocardia sp. NPDC050630 TaxID=3364321 RepID=UPI0037B4FE2E
MNKDSRPAHLSERQPSWPAEMTVSRALLDARRTGVDIGAVLDAAYLRVIAQAETGE